MVPLDYTIPASAIASIIAVIVILLAAVIAVFIILAHKFTMNLFDHTGVPDVCL